MTPADGNQVQGSARAHQRPALHGADAEATPSAPRREVVHAIYRCKGCKTPTALCALNDDMLCEACGEPSEDRSDMTARERFGYGRPFDAQREWGTF